MVTKTALAAYLGVDEATLPANVPKLLRDAEDLVQHAIMDRTPEDDGQREAYDQAVYAQVELWIETGDPLGVAANGQYKSVSVGSLKLDYNTDQAQGGREVLAPRARRYLLRAGLLFRGVLAGTFYRGIWRR